MSPNYIGVKGMRKTIATICLALFAMAIPAKAEGVWSSDDLSMKEEAKEIKIVAKNQNVRIVNAAKQQVKVYSLTGMCVAAFTVDAEDKTYTLNCSKGIYILKVGNVTRKISVSQN